MLPKAHVVRERTARSQRDGAASSRRRDLPIESGSRGGWICDVHSEAEENVFYYSSVFEACYLGSHVRVDSAIPHRLFKISVGSHPFSSLSSLKLHILFRCTRITVSYSHSLIFESSEDCLPDSPTKGFQCFPQLSHHWGQYSPFFSIPSLIPSTLPSSCSITFAQLLSRHGARDPTADKSAHYNSTIHRIKTTASHLEGKYAFLKDFEYKLGADQLTAFGQQEMVNEGIWFYERYHELARDTEPFIRASGEQRVVESAQKFSQGYHQARQADHIHDPKFPYPILEISETEGSNNT